MDAGDYGAPYGAALRLIGWAVEHPGVVRAEARRIGFAPPGPSRSKGADADGGGRAPFWADLGLTLRDVCDLSHAVQVGRAERLLLASVSAGVITPADSHERLANFERSLTHDDPAGSVDDSLIARIRRQVGQEAA